MAVESREHKWLGKSVPRKEDERFVRGKGSYVDDIRLPGMLHMSILRSPFAHAKINSIDTSRAQELPGVVAVVTGELLAQHNLGHPPFRPQRQPVPAREQHRRPAQLARPHVRR